MIPVVAVTQPDYLDGVVIRPEGQDPEGNKGPEGGNDEMAAVHLYEEGTTYRCTTSAQLASKLGAYLGSSPIRVFGTASWTRREAGGWELQRFVVEDFVPLEDKSLSEALAELESLPSPDPNE